jgi:chorismate synthase
MSHNSFGHLFRFTTWGESHGPSIGCVVDGTPPRIELCENDIQKFLDKRKPGQSKFTSPRKESDEVKILSGIIEDDGRKLTTGTPISLIIENTDQRSKTIQKLKKNLDLVMQIIHIFQNTESEMLEVEEDNPQERLL